MGRANVDLVLDACEMLNQYVERVASEWPDPNDYLDWNMEQNPSSQFTREQLRIFCMRQLGQAHQSEHGARIFVSSEMVDLCVAAEPSLPEAALVLDEIPWDKATVVFEKSPWEYFGHPVDILQWEKSGSEDYPTSPNRICDIVQWGIAGAGVFAMVPCQWIEGTPPTLGKLGEGDSIVWRTMYVLWSFLRDRIALTETQPAPKASYRRWERATGKPPEDIVVITLRRPTSKKPEDANVAAIDWTHQWVVDGHWRNQWYPATQRHRPKWIAAHIKGPEDKPLVVKERIYAWTR